jgi:hypothetical protein
MRLALTSLARNLVAGLRLALFLPVARLAFRIDLLQLVLLFVLSAAIDVAGDWLRTGDDREFSLLGFGTELYSGALLLLASAVLALVWRQRALALAVPVIVMASVPVGQVLNFLVPLYKGGTFVFELVGVFGATLFQLWMVVILVRSVAVAFAPPPARVWLSAIGGGLLLAAPIWLSSSFATNDPWWQVPGTPTAAPDGMSAGSEAVLATQAALLDHALSDIADERPGATDLYFVGFAPYGRDDGFRRDVDAAQKVMDERWGTTDRSLLLINSPQTLLTAPFATITNLREALNEIGAAIAVEEDVVMVYLTSPGGRGSRLTADLPPLSLVELTPPGLRQLLDDAGIKWRIIVVSACHSGGFIEPLRDDHTLIVTSSRAGQAAPGCGKEEATAFGEAFFQKGMASAASFAAAFDVARLRVAERERDARIAQPSEPQWWIGPEMADKLAGMRRGGPASGVLTRFVAPGRGGFARAVDASRRLTPLRRAATMRCRSSSTCQ